MRKIGVFRGGMLFLASLGMIYPPSALSAAAAADAPAARATAGRSSGLASPAPGPARETPASEVDVALRSGGVLVGQAIELSGKPLAKTPVSIRQGEREVAVATTDGSGYFAVRGLHGGVCDVRAGEAHGLYRVWAPGTAPSSAQPGALVVAGGNQVRGQRGPVMYWLCNPWVIAGLVGAAVAIPIAIHQQRIHRTASP